MIIENRELAITTKNIFINKKLKKKEKSLPLQEFRVHIGINIISIVKNDAYYIQNKCEDYYIFP